MKAVYRQGMSLIAGLALLTALACSDDTTTTTDTGITADAGVDQTVSPKEAGADGAQPQGDGALADSGSPDASIVTAGWAVSMGGTGLDDPVWGKGVTTDSKGNVYLIGTRFKKDITLGSKTLTTKGDYDGWVAKLDSAGKVLWAAQIGGAADQKMQYVQGICLDSKDTPHIVGYYKENVTLGAKAYTSKSQYYDGYIASLAPADGKVTWSLALTAATADDVSSLRDCAFDSAGRLLAVGGFTGSYTVGGATIKTAGKDEDALLLRLSADRSKVELAAGFGGSGAQQFSNLGLASSGEIYASGSFSTSLSLGGKTTAAVDGSEMFLAQLSSAGKVNWAVTGLGKGTDSIIRMVVDGSGNAYLGGQIGAGIKTSAPAFKIGSFSLSIGTDREMFLARVDKTGKVTWAKSARYVSPLGGYAYETIRGIALDKKDRLVVTGQAYADQDFFGKKLVPPNPTGGFHVVLGRMASGGDAEWAVSYGHPTAKYAHGNAVAVDPKGDIILVGIYTDKVMVGGKTFTSKGSYDFFVHKVTPPK